ncbi:uncharacterized protein LOC132045027 [Lycium ferocissimum]|uniref:uncharacterized protein LOC132045027 n=1 Tax=Lycium ferocissimum TaxID=112874 RepID=UPI0028164FF1|nr:uncharacterized protein LOC132045027 [Lycium ferocissimum]
MYKVKPPFPQRLAKKNDDAKCQKFYDQLKQLTVNFPFLDAVKEMAGFSKFVKDLLTKKRLHAFARALYDNGGSINLLPLAIFKQFGLGMPRLTSMRLQMADRSIKKPVGVIDDVLVQVGKFMLPADFVILDCAVDKDIPIILGRPFLAMGRVLMDSEKNEIKFRVNDEEVTFQASKGMKLPSAYENISVIDLFDGIDDLEEDSKPSVEHQRRLNQNMQEVMKKEIIKWLDAGVVYSIADSKWVSPVQYVPKKGSITVVPNAKNELIPTRTGHSDGVFVDYRKLNSPTCKDHFPCRSLIKSLDRLAGSSYYCFLDR